MAQPMAHLPPHIYETPVRHPQGRYQAASRDLGLCCPSPPQGVDQLTPLGYRERSRERRPGPPPTRSNAPKLEVTSDAVRPVMTVYWGCDAVTLVVCHDCTCVAAGSRIMHSFCGLLGPGTSRSVWKLGEAHPADAFRTCDTIPRPFGTLFCRQKLAVSLLGRNRGGLQQRSVV